MTTSTREQLYAVVAALQPVLYGVQPGRLDDPSPCPDWTVRDLVQHVLGTTESLRRVGAREQLDAQDPWGTEGGHVDERWAETLSHQLRHLVEAWAQPEAWEGEVMDGARTRQQVGDMAFVEVMVHGWDLARATGQELAYGDDAVAAGTAVMDEMGETGREMGVFGPEVELDGPASAFDRLLAKTGRDPHWGDD